MRLRWVFTVQTAVILLKKTPLNSCLIGLGIHCRACGSARENGFNNIFSQIFFTVSCGPVVTMRAGMSNEGPKFDSEQNLFLFASFLFFFLSSFHFSYCSFVLFLYIASNF